MSPGRCRVSNLATGSCFIQVEHLNTRQGEGDWSPDHMPYGSIGFLENSGRLGD